MSGIERSEQVDELPPAEWLGVIVKAAISAHLATCKPRQADAFLMEMARILSDEEAIARLMPVRAASHHATQTRERRKAMAWFGAQLSTFTGKRSRE